MGKGMGNFLRQAQKMQEKMVKMQQELSERIAEASSGGGMVTVKVNGKYEVLSLKIDPEVVNKEDVEMLEDLIVAAVNEAMRKIQEQITSEMGKLTGGMKIPGLM